MCPRKILRFTATLAFACATACRDPAGGTSGSTAVADSAAPSLPLPPEVPLSPSVCMLRTRRFLPTPDVSIALSGTAPPFARFGGRSATPSARSAFPVSAELGMPSDPDMPFAFHVHLRGLNVSGQVERTFPVHAAHPLALGKFAAALPTTTLHVLRATSVDVDDEATLGSSVEIVGEPIRARGPCGLFGIERTGFIATTVIPGVQWKDEPNAALQKGRRIPLTTLPIGEPVAWLKLGPDDDAGVSLLEKENGRAHIAWFGGPALVYGWIAASDLAPGVKPPSRSGSAATSAPASAAASASASASASATPDRATPHSTMKCKETVSLVAKIGEARAAVGSLGSGTSFDVLSKSEGWADVTLDSPPLRFTPGTRLLVRESDLASCTGAK